FYIRRHTGAVVADANLYTIAKAFGRGRERRLVVSTTNLRPAPGCRIEAVCNHIQKSAPNVLRENVCSTGSRIKGLLDFDFKTLRLGPRSVPCEIEAFLNQRIDINHPMLTGALARVLQHILDNGIRAFAMMHDLVEIALEQVGQFFNFSSGFIVKRHTLQYVP